MTKEDGDAYLLHSFERQIRDHEQRAKALETAYPGVANRMEAESMRRDAEFHREQAERLKLLHAERSSR